MGNGTFASKFKLGQEANSEDNSQGPHHGSDEEKNPQTPLEKATFNCEKCYRLKKKCLRSYPTCYNCAKTGTACVYSQRNNKKKRPRESDSGEEGGKGETETLRPVTFAFDIIDKPDTENNNSEPVNNSTDNSGKTSVSIPTLLATGKKNGDSDHSNRHDVGSQKYVTMSEHKKRAHSPKLLLLERPLRAISSLPHSQSTNLREELIIVSPIEEPLPMNFVLSYFSNYEILYPIINKTAFLDSFKGLELNEESMVNLDVYLVMCIGCLIYDVNNKTEHFKKHFNDSVVHSVMDVLSFTKNELNDDNENLENLKILILLVIYASCTFNYEFCWSLVGVIDRLIVELNYFKPVCSRLNFQQRIFWSAFNLDVELSMSLGRYSLLPSPQLVSLPLPSERFHDGEPLELIREEIIYYTYQARLLHLSYLDKPDHSELSTLRRDLDEWHVSVILTVYASYSNDPLLQDYSCIVNLKYNFLTVMIELSSSASWSQFTLQYLSNSFFLMVQEPPHSDKARILPGISNLFWFNSFTRVAYYCVASFVDYLNANANLESEQSTSLLRANNFRYNDFATNLQLMVNLLSHLSTFEVKSVTVEHRIDTFLQTLTFLRQKLMNSNCVQFFQDQSQDLIESVKSLH